MRFDLEISNTNVDLMYIPEGIEIPQGAISTYYVGIDSRNAIPSDFISLEENILNNPFSGRGAIEISGPSFYVSSNQFLLTNIAKYVTSENVRVPLFFRHIIHSSVAEDGIKITDYAGGAISKDEYLVEQGDTFTYIYMNKSSKILFIEYVSDKRSYRKLINLQPIFTEANWDEMLSGNGVPANKYTFLSNGQVETSYAGSMYILYQNAIGLIRKPICNMDDPWYIGIKNVSFNIEDKFNKRLYHIPEFYIQHAFLNSQHKYIPNNKCKILFLNYVKLQAQPAVSKITETILYVYNFYTGKLKSIHTMNPNRKGEHYIDDIYFNVIEDYNFEGIAKLSVGLTDEDVVYADYYIDDNVYELRIIDFSTSILTHGGYINLFIIPNANDGESAVYCAYIGKSDKRTIIEKFGAQGVGFSNIEEYNAFIEHYNCYHLAMIAVSSTNQADILSLYDARRVGSILKQKKMACLQSADVLYKDIMDGSLTLPTRDTLIAMLDVERLMLENIVNINEYSAETDNFSMTFFNKLEDVISKNLDVSTSFITQVKLNNLIPPSHMIGIMEGYITVLAGMSANEQTGIGE